MEESTPRRDKAEKAQIILIDAPLEALLATCLLSPFLADERPLRGANGLADWRLNGKISEELQRQRLQGHHLETLLIPTAHRLKIQNLILIGMGLKSAVDENVFKNCLAHAVSLLQRSKIEDFIFAFNASLPAEKQMLWLGEFLTTSAKGDLRRREEGKGVMTKLPVVWKILVTAREKVICAELLAERFKEIKVSISRQPAKPQATTASTPLE